MIIRSVASTSYVAYPSETCSKERPCVPEQKRTFSALLTFLRKAFSRRNEVPHATISDRTELRRAAERNSRCGSGGKASERRCGRPMAVLLPECRQEEDLLSIRGAQSRRNPRGGAQAGPAGGRDSRTGRPADHTRAGASCA